MNSGLLYLSNKVAPFNLCHNIREVWLKVNNVRCAPRTKKKKKPRTKGTFRYDTSAEDGATLQQLLIVPEIVNGVINIHISCLCILEEDTDAPFYSLQIK